jgi:uncharacterized protein
MRSQSRKNRYTSSFQPAAILKNPHLQTIWAAKIRRLSKFNCTFEHIELPDGDFLELAWSPSNHRGTVLLLHGLEGGIESKYIQGQMKLLDQKGYQSVLLHFRGCGKTPNRLDRSYHAGDTCDLSYISALLRERLGKNLSAIVGFSLGANVLLKWLGESNRSDIINKAIAVSPPFDLASSADHLDTGLSKLYQYHLVENMKKKYRQKFINRGDKISDKLLKTLTSFRKFDNFITGPLHGFDNAEEYYQKSSCRQFLKNIQTPTLIVHSEDDPFLPATSIPKPHELGPKTEMELSKNGGHIGFIKKEKNGMLGYWLESRIHSYIADFNEHLI